MLRDLAAQAHARAKIAIRAFEPRRRIHAIAVCGVVETIVGAHVADDRRARVHADPRYTEREPVCAMGLTEAFAVAIPSERAADRAPRVIGLRQRCAEKHRDAVADDAVDRAAILERDS